jgi:hypothetical protein
VVNTVREKSRIIAHYVARLLRLHRRHLSHDLERAAHLRVRAAPRRGRGVCAERTEHAGAATRVLRAVVPGRERGGAEVAPSDRLARDQVPEHGHAVQVAEQPFRQAVPDLGGLNGDLGGREAVSNRKWRVGKRGARG